MQFGGKNVLQTKNPDRGSIWLLLNPFRVPDDKIDSYPELHSVLFKLNPFGFYN